METKKRHVDNAISKYRGMNLYVLPESLESSDFYSGQALVLLCLQEMKKADSLLMCSQNIALLWIELIRIHIHSLIEHNRIAPTRVTGLAGCYQCSLIIVHILILSLKCTEAH